MIINLEIDSEFLYTHHGMVFGCIILPARKPSPFSKKQERPGVVVFLDSICKIRADRLTITRSL